MSCGGFSYSAAEQANAQAEAQAQLCAYQQQMANAYRGTMQPESNDPDAGCRDHGAAINLVYDELEDCYVPQRMIGAK